ncbi:MAG: carbamate kinase [Candidatus Coatesbacteria bacterium]|nr:carbamate kinase [Candidatus Coatesbacteria bacterium]
MSRKILAVAFGGNAIKREGEEGNIYQQFARTRQSLIGIVEMVKRGYEIIITHGNGPQVGDMLLMAERAKVEVPELPLGVLVAATQGTMGYMLQQSLQNMLRKAGIRKEVVTILSQALVHLDDPALENPTKPIGPFYSKEEALKHEKNGWIVKEDAGRGYRRVVPSPKPYRIWERHTVSKLLEEGCVVIASGGGGIPCYLLQDGKLEGIDAVIDKDWATAVLADDVVVETLIILTAVDKVSINFKKPDQKELDVVTAREMQRYLDEGHFGSGSMEPKVAASLWYLKNGGVKAIISHVDKLVDAFDGKTGTHIVPD